MTTQLTKNNDYTILINTALGTILSFVPVLSNLYNAAMSAQTEARLTELEEELKIQKLELDRLNAFITTDAGYSLFRKCVQHSLNCDNKIKIKIFVSILNSCYKLDSVFDIQYNNILMQTISEMTSAEFQLLAYIDSYCKEYHNFQKPDIPPDEFYIVDKDKEFYKSSFNKYLSTQTNGAYLLENAQFFLLRLSNLGVIKANRRVIESYNITPLGKQLLSYIEQSIDF